MNSESSKKAPDDVTSDKVEVKMDQLNVNGGGRPDDDEEVSVTSSGKKVRFGESVDINSNKNDDMTFFLTEETAPATNQHLRQSRHNDDVISEPGEGEQTSDFARSENSFITVDIAQRGDAT